MSTSIDQAEGLADLIAAYYNRLRKQGVDKDQAATLSAEYQATLMKMVLEARKSRSSWYHQVLEWRKR